MERKELFEFTDEREINSFANILKDELKKRKMNDENYTLCVHGIGNKTNNPLATCDSIIQNGLENHSIGGILSNCMVLGNGKKINYSEILNYSYNLFNNDDGKNTAYNVVCCLPDRLYDADGNLYYLGDVSKSVIKDIEENGSREYLKYANHTNSLLINQKINDDKLLPKEFILGYLVTNENNTKFILNKEFILFMKKEERNKFIEEFTCNNQFHKISRDASYNDERHKLEEIIQKMKKYNVKTDYYDQLIDIVGDYELMAFMNQIKSR